MIVKTKNTVSKFDKKKKAQEQKVKNDHRHRKKKFGPKPIKKTQTIMKAYCRGGKLA